MTDPFAVNVLELPVRSTVGLFIHHAPTVCPLKNPVLKVLLAVNCITSLAPEPARSTEEDGGTITCNPFAEPVATFSPAAATVVGGLPLPCGYKSAVRPARRWSVKSSAVMVCISSDSSKRSSVPVNTILPLTIAAKEFVPSGACELVEK